MKAEENKDAEQVAAKHEKLTDEKDEGVELMQNKFTKNISSPFINQQRSWEDEDHFTIQPDLIKGITEELGFLKPSNIQAVAIPLIAKDFRGSYLNLIA